MTVNEHCIKFNGSMIQVSRGTNLVEFNPINNNLWAVIFEIDEKTSKIKYFGCFKIEGYGKFIEPAYTPEDRRSMMFDKEEVAYGVMVFFDYVYYDGTQFTSVENAFSAKNKVILNHEPTVEELQSIKERFESKPNVASKSDNIRFYDVDETTDKVSNKFDNEIY